ncbi:MAG: FG-GAP repeat domain-containing protein [Planctomycetota bacterium]
MGRNSIAAIAILATTVSAQVPSFGVETPTALANRVFVRSAVADLDGDGDLDLFGVSQAPNVYSVFRNDGDVLGRLRMTNVSNAAFASATVRGSCEALFDADGDGDLDLFVGGGGTFAGMYRNSGSGTFTKVQSLLFAAWPSAATAADLDGDGDLDLVLSGDGDTNAEHEIAINDGTGTFSAGPSFGIPWRGRMVDIDFDSDGDRDLLIVERLSSTVVGSHRLLRNDGGLTFTDVSAAQLLMSPAPQPTQLLVRDVDGDGDEDVVMASQYYALILDNDNGQLRDGHGMNGGRSVAVTDVDGDGDLDILRLKGTPATLHLERNDGQGGFQSWNVVPSYWAEHLTVADFDRDGDDEVVLGSPLAFVNVLRNRQLDLVVSTPTVGQSWSVEVRSYPGYATAAAPMLLAVGLARLPQAVELPPLGVLHVDLSLPNLQVADVLPAPAGQRTSTFAIPNVAGLAGIALHTQVLVDRGPLPPRLTAVRSVVVQ